MPNYKLIAWDFDGVLNANVENGVFRWMSTFEADMGLPIRSLSEFLFTGRFQKAMVGEADLHELVGEWTLALEMGAVLEDLAGTIHAHPTMTEMTHEAVLASLGHAIHVTN